MAFEFTSKSDKWVKCISNSGTIRAIAIDAPEIANQMKMRHQTSPAATVALAESVIAGLILSSYCKTGEKINLNIKGSGWCHQAIVDANSEAEVRGYVVERPQEKVELGPNVGPWGIGVLSVLRTKFDEAQPYIGTVPLITGRLPKDLTFYWLQSEQVQSAVGIEVTLNEQNEVDSAQGFLIQALPGATEQDLQFIEKHLKQVHALDPHSAQRSSPTHLLSYLLENQGFSVLEEKPLSFKCGCSLERVKRALVLTGVEELRSMLEENKDVEVGCDFCSEKYLFSPEMIQGLIRNEDR
jgi:molecular chaperone Hsp33